MSEISKLKFNDLGPLLLDYESSNGLIPLYEIQTSQYVSFDVYKVILSGVESLIFSKPDHSGNCKVIPFDENIFPLNFIRCISPSIEKISSSALNVPYDSGKIGKMAMHFGLSSGSTLRFLDAEKHPRLAPMLYELESLHGGEIRFESLNGFAPGSHNRDAYNLYNSLNNAIYELRYGHSLHAHFDNQELVINAFKSIGGRVPFRSINLPLEKEDLEGVGFNSFNDSYSYKYKSLKIGSINNATVNFSFLKVPLSESSYMDVYSALKGVEFVCAQEDEARGHDVSQKITSHIRNLFEEHGVSIRIAKGIKKDISQELSQGM